MLLNGIENGSDWHWPPKSFWPFWLRILGNSSCPRNNSSQIRVRITEFAPNMHPGILSSGIENGGHWLCLSRSFWPFNLGFWKIRLVCMITWTDLSQNHQLCTNYASWDSLSWYWKWGSLILTFKVIRPLFWLQSTRMARRSLTDCPSTAQDAQAASYRLP